MPAVKLALGAIWAPHRFIEVLDDWGDDAFDFLRHQVPRIVAVLVIAFVLSRLLKLVSRHLGELSNRQDLPSSVRSQQLRTLSSVIYSVGVIVIIFIAAMQILPLLGINMGPLLASAGIAGLAIGFGAQALVKDFINGFFILAENQYDIGDTIRIAGVQGAVENVTLRRTVLRDSDGTVHTVPSSEIKVVSNLTRDWTQINLHVSVAYGADSEQVIGLLKQVGEEMASDPNFGDMIVARPEVAGIEKVSGNEVDYLMLIKTKPGAQYAVRRELRRRIKSSFEKNNIDPGDPSRVFVTGIAKSS
ncbi:MAG TPA: mechanosensitive ion channel family protein [Candidatus Limnocylindrales bacterium]|jgi:small-conductance mechanosensitive channel|nr:mechanosensitive ion channel family protein [Candidatus Limnocylindrales bacterium]